MLYGAWLFQDVEGMRARKREEPSQRYSALWYSLDLFLPFIDLYAAEEWAPTEDRAFALFYMRIHALFGWIMIPIGLVAITGIIK